MADVSIELKKKIESLNKTLYRSNKVSELYDPIFNIINDLLKDLKDIEKIYKKNEHLGADIEIEIRKRELLSLFKKMYNVIFAINQDMSSISKELLEGNKFFEKFRSYRTYVFKDAKKSQEYVNKLIELFSIKEFVLKFNVVGTIDLNDVTEKVNGTRKGIEIYVPSENLNLIYEEILKSKKIKFRLIFGSVVIYFEKDNVLYIEGTSKKIKLCDIEAAGFNAKILDN